VEPAHRVREGRGAQREGRHVEAARLAGGAAEGEEAIEREAELATVRAEVLLDEVGREDVEARRHRGVGREDAPRPGRLERLGERQALLTDEAADALEAEERRVALVHVEDDRLEPEGAQRAQPADPSTISCRMRFSWSPP